MEAISATPASCMPGTPHKGLGHRQRAHAWNAISDSFVIECAKSSQGRSDGYPVGDAR